MPPSVSKPGERVDHRGFQRLDRREGRQDAGQAGGEHGFAGPRRAHHEEVVPPGGSDFKGAFGALLPLHFAEVAGVAAARHFARLGRGKGGATGVVVEHLLQRGGGEDLGGADPGGLGPAGAGAEERAVFDGGGHGGG